MKKKLINLSEFTKNIATIMSGSAIAQILVFLLTPILTRIFEPSVFGTVAGFTAVHSIIAVTSTLFYSQAIMVDTNSEDAKSTAVVSIISSIIIGMITAAGCIVYAYIIETTSLTNLFLILLPIEVCLTGIRDTSNMWNTRNKKYKEISIILILFSVGSTLFNIVLGLIGWGARGLVVGKFIAIFMNSVLSVYVMIKKTNYTTIKITKNNINKSVLKHKNYPIFNMPSQLLNTSSIQLPILLISTFYGAFEVGSYSKATSLIQLPLSLVGNAMSTVFFQHASQLNNEKDFDGLYSLTLNSYRKMLVFSIIPLIILVGFGDILFGLVLGQKWIEAGRYASILSPWFILSFLTSPFSTILYLKNKHKQNFNINLILVSTRVGIVFFTGIYGYTMKTLLFISSIAGVVIWAGFNSYILKLVGIKYRKSILPTLVIIGVSISLGVLFRIIFNSFI